MILSALLALSLVQGIPARAFAYDTVPARLDSLIARAAQDSTLTLTRNGPAVVILWGPRKRLADSLPVWCTRSCVWEWDELQGASTTPGDTSTTLASTWGVQMVGAPAAWAMGARGQGVIVTSLDSGIDPNHPGYVVAGGYHAVARADTGWADTIGDCRGHGTHVAGTMADRTGRGVAPEATVYGVRVFEPIPCGAYTSNQIVGLNWASMNGSRAVNISISGTNSYSLNQAVIAANARGTVVCRANGNSGSPPPQGTPNEIQTAALSGDRQRMSWSNYGPGTDLAAPGNGIESTMPGGGYGTKSGTSMAAPHVCGAAALVISADPSLSADSVQALLKRSALPIGSPIPNDYTGYGLVRADRAIALHRGGVEVAGPKQEVVEASAIMTRCHAIVAVRQWSATTNDPGVTLASTPDQLCITVDPAIAPSAITVTMR